MKLSLGYSLTVGQLILDQSVGVRIPVPQPFTHLTARSFASYSVSSMTNREVMHMRRFLLYLLEDSWRAD